MQKSTSHPNGISIPIWFRSSFYCCCAFLLIGLVTPLSAQQSPLRFNHLRLEDGLSQSINAFVCQDSAGFVWISTLDGLNRFDGINIRKYKSQQGDSLGMKGDNIQSEFYLTAEQDIWFCTDIAINVYRRQTGRIEHYSLDSLFAPGLSLQYYVFHLDDQRRLWVKVNQRLFQFDIDTQTVREIGKIEGLRAKVVSSNSGAITIYTYDKGFRKGARRYLYSENPFSWRQLTDVVVEHHLHDLVTNAPDQLFFAASNGLVAYAPVSNSAVLFDQTSQGDIRGVLAIEKTKEGFLLLSSTSGLHWFDPTRSVFVRSQSSEADNRLGLADNKTWELHLDDQQNIWVSLWTIGLDYAQFEKPKFLLFQPRIRYPNTINETGFDPGDMIQDRSGRLWLSSQQDGLLVYDQNENLLPTIYQHPSLEKLLKGAGIHQLLESRQGDVWIVPFQNYLIHFDRKTEVFTKVSLPGANRRYLGKLLEIEADRFLFTGKSEAGIWAIESHGGQFEARKATDFSQQNQFYDQSYWTTDNQLILFKENGGIDAFSLEGGNLAQFDSREMDGQTYTVAELENGSVLLGGSFGLFQYHPHDQSLHNLSGRGPEALSYVYSIEKESEEVIWISTNSGLVRYDLSAEQFQVFTEMDGLQSREFNRGSSMRTQGGELWFGGINGYNIFRPEDAESQVPLAKVNIINIAVNDQVQSDSILALPIPQMDLAYWQNNLYFEFVSSEYSDPQANLLRYRLERADGSLYDEDWIQVKNGEGKVRYPKLPSGSYRFLVDGSNSDGVWTEKPRSIVFTVATPIWETWWFRLLGFLLILGLVARGITAYYRHRLRLQSLTIREQRLFIEKEEALQKERDRMAKDMHDELGGGLTAIRLLLKKVKRKIPLDIANQELDRIDQHSSDIIKNMRFIVWALQKDNEQLDNFIAYIRHHISQTLEDHDIESNWKMPLELPDYSLPGITRKHLWLCVKEITHNVIKHAKASLVELKIELEEGTLTIIAADNGIGIPDLKEKAFGYGLNNIRDRMEKIGGNANFHTASGTTVTLTLPLDTIATHSL